MNGFVLALALMAGLSSSAQAGVKLPAQPSRIAPPVLAQTEREAAPYKLPPFKADASFSQQALSELDSVLDVMGRIRGDAGTALHQKVFGAVHGQNYLDFVGKGVRSFHFEPAVFGGLAYVSDEDPNAITVSGQLFTPDFPAIMRIALLLHEARHAGSGKGVWTHADCPTPLLDGNGREVRAGDGSSMSGVKEGCDSKALGAYGVQVIFLGNIMQHCTNCTGKMKQDAAIMAKAYFPLIFGDARLEIARDMGAAQ